jgi:hypothetical protein
MSDSRAPFKPTKLSSPGRIVRERSDDGTESFSIEGDFDMDEINPPMFPNAASGPAKASSTTPNTNSSRPLRPTRDVEDDGLTDDERANLADWGQTLQTGDTVRVTGAKPIRPYSKFAAENAKLKRRKVGKVPRPGKGR